MGFIGRHFVAELLRRGWRVRSLDIADRPSDDITMGALNEHTEKFDLVVHAAAVAPHRVGIDRIPASAVHNTLIDSTLFDWAIATSQRHVLYVSSCAVYSDDTVLPFKEDDGFDSVPFDMYGVVKRHGEKLANVADMCGVPTTIIRPFSGYGPDQSFKFPFGAFRDRIVDGADPFKIWGDSGQTRDFVHIQDIVGASLALVEQGVTNRPVNICTGVATSMLTLAETFINTARMLDDKPRVTPRIEVDTSAPMGVLHRVGDPTLMQQFYTPKWSLQDGITDTLRRAGIG